MRTPILFSLFLILFTHVNAQDWINFKESIPVRETCDGTYVKYTVPVSQNSNSKVALIFKGSNVPSLKLYFKGKHIDKGEVFKISNKKDLKKISADFLVNTGIRDPHLLFTQIVDDQVRVFKIKIGFGYYPITKHTESLKISGACLDSITLLFPFHGTQTDSYLCKMVDGQYKALTAQTYMCCSYGNSYKISKNDLGIFRLNLTGCYNSKVTCNFETK